MIKPLTLSQRLLERADASDEDCRTDDGDIMREADDALKAAANELSQVRQALRNLTEMTGVPFIEAIEIARAALKEQPHA